MGTIGSVSALLLLDRVNLVSMISLLEAFLVLYCAFAFFWARSKNIPTIIAIQITIVLYFGLSLLYAVVYRGANILDFLMIYKSFFYLFLLTFLANKKLMEGKHILTFYNVLLAVFFFKYLAVVAFGITARPVVYDENNFELTLLYALYIVRYSITKDKYLPFLVLVGIITIISLSRSSLVMYAVLAMYVFYDSFKKTWVFILPVAMAVMAFGIYYIFSERSSSLEEIDRYRFMLLFLDEVKDWSVLQWFVGAERITPLSYTTCGLMSTWTTLFSYSGDGTCYSVILHSFLFRVILDHGIIGLIFIIYAVNQLLIKSGVEKLHALVFIAIVVLNGLSVSSFNNLFFAISMVFLMTTTRNKIKKSPLALSVN